MNAIGEEKIEKVLEDGDSSRLDKPFVAGKESGVTLGFLSYLKMVIL